MRSDGGRGGWTSAAPATPRAGGDGGPPGTPPERGGRGGSSQLRIPRDVLRVVLALLIFIAVGRAHQQYSFIGAVRPALLLFCAGAAYVVLDPSSVRWRNLWSSWPPKVVLALGVLACLSVPFGISMGSSGRFIVEGYSKMLLTFFLLLLAVRGPRDLYLYVWTYVLACGFLVYLSFFAFTLGGSGEMQRLGGLVFYDSNDLGVVLTVGIPLCLVLLQNSGRAGRLVSGAVLLGIGASLARSGSRGGFLALLAVGIVLLFLLRQVSVLKRAAAVVALAVGLFVMAPEGYWEQMETLTEPTEDYNWQAPYGRKAVAERGLGYMLDNPLLGVGAGNFPRAEGILAEESQRRARMGVGYRWTAAHNSFVQIGAELGIPGLLLFCSLVFGGMAGVARLRRRMPRGWRRRGGEHRFVYDLATYLPVSLVGFAVAGFFVSFAYTDVFYVLVVLVAGTYVCARHLARREVASRAAGGRVPAGRPAAARRR